MFLRNLAKRLVIAAIGLFAASALLGCQSTERKPAASKSCGDPTCDTKH